MDDIPVYVSEEMKELIKDSEAFSFPPIGPVGDCINSTVFQHQIPPSFLQSYIVNSNEDARRFHQLFVQNKEYPLTILVYPFKQKVLYDDVKMDAQMLEMLQSENPVIANLIIDHFGDDLNDFNKYIYTGPGTSNAHDFEAGSKLRHEKVQADKAEMVNDDEQPEQKGVTTEVPGVVTEQPDEVETSTLQPLVGKQSHEKEVATEQFLKRCKAIKGSKLYYMYLLACSIY